MRNSIALGRIAFFSLGALAGASTAAVLTSVLLGKARDAAGHDRPKTRATESGAAEDGTVAYEDELRRSSDIKIRLLRAANREAKAGNFKAAEDASKKLYAIDDTLGLLSLSSVLRMTGRHEEFARLAAVHLDSVERGRTFNVLQAIFVSLEEAKMLDDAKDILDERNNSLPRDMLDYFRAGILWEEGKKDEAKRMLGNLPKDEFWEVRVRWHPAVKGSFGPGVASPGDSAEN